MYNFKQAMLFLNMNEDKKGLILLKKFFTVRIEI